MQIFTIIFERLPMVWFLLGLLFNVTGLYLGFEYSLAFGYMLIGWACCAYGLAILVLRLLDNPKKVNGDTIVSKVYLGRVNRLNASDAECRKPAGEGTFGR